MRMQITSRERGRNKFEMNVHPPRGPLRVCGRESFGTGCTRNTSIRYPDRKKNEGEQPGSGFEN